MYLDAEDIRGSRVGEITEEVFLRFGVFRFMNSSRGGEKDLEANVRFEVEGFSSDLSTLRLHVVAIKDIYPNDELKCNYPYKRGDTGRVVRRRRVGQ